MKALRPFLLMALVLPAFAIRPQMGSPGGGETQAIALHPEDPKILYAGAARGLCKTLNGGLDNWPSSGLESLSPRHVVIDPFQPDTIYAGTYEMGIYKSTDAAGSWQAANEGLTLPAIRGLVIDPHRPAILYAGTDGGGVFKTMDGGRSWREKNRGLIDKTIRTLLIHPENPSILWAGTWHGIYKTTDGGENWEAGPDEVYDVDVRALALDPSDPDVIYAGTNPRGVFRSQDGGLSWKQGRRPLTEVILALAVDPSAPSHVYAGTLAGVFRSTDAGDSFQPAGLQWSNRTWTLVFDPRTEPPTLYYGGEGGVLKTRNGGLLWEVTGPQRP